MVILIKERLFIAYCALLKKASFQFYTTLVIV